jgi:outer membrane protein OmpA-like peptidoglycan-associated protein
LLLFGLSEGSGGLTGSVFHAAYEGFGNVAKQQYPKLIAEFPTTDKAVNTSFIEALSKRMAVTSAETQSFDSVGDIAPENVVARKNWSIQFDTGSDRIRPESEATLKQLYDGLLTGAALSIEIEGHTDDAGNPDSNQTLSEKRAFAVKTYLQDKAPAFFPDNRINVKAFGQSKPLVPNSSAENRAKNRRVTIILGTR